MRARWSRCRSLVGARLEDRVAVGQGVELQQPLERHLGESAAAATQFEHARTGAERSQRHGEDPGDGGGEQPALLGRGDEVAGRAELGAAGAVVTQARCVQAQLHEAGERDRAAGRTDLGAQVRGQRVGMGLGKRIGERQVGMHRVVQRRVFAETMGSIAERGRA